MTDAPLPAHLLDYLSEAIDAAAEGLPAPSTADLKPEELELAETILADMAPVDVGDIEPIPFAEDPIAVRLGLVASPPPVAINPAAFAGALAGQDLAELMAELGDYGHEVDRAWLSELLAGTVGEVPPHLLRTIAALLDVEPGELAARHIEPYPVAHVAGLEARVQAPWQIHIEDGEVHLASPEHRLGVLVAHVASVDNLDALNVRRVAWELLTTRWIRHSACVVISPTDNYSCIVIDAIDCQPHQHAPTGLLTYGPSPVPGPIVDVLREYGARFRVTWTPPAALADDTLGEQLIPNDAVTGIYDVLTGRYDEPKLSAFANVRDRLVQKQPAAWEAMIQDLHDPDNPDAVDTALQTLMNP